MSEMEIKTTKGYLPGSLGRVVELHSAYYHEHWGFGLFFEAKVALEISEFFKRYDENRDGFWTVLADGREIPGHCRLLRLGREDC